MARARITEFRAKTLLLSELNLRYEGISVTHNQDLSKLAKQLKADKKYTLKVDQGVKSRFTQGLVKLNLSPKQTIKELNRLKRKGFERFLIEEYIPHRAQDEKFLALERTREGIKVLYAQVGGINIEKETEKVKTTLIPYQTSPKISHFVTKTETFSKILKAFNKYYFSFMEINPFITIDNQFYPLDLAVEADTAAESKVKGAWTQKDIVEASLLQKTEEEKAVEKLASTSQASFKLDLINPNGSIFLLLSGGGASLVIADEVYNYGFGKLLGNYGEYSGNPTSQETYIYTKAVLSLLAKSKSKKKTIIIGGGVANFTDIRLTFKGIIKALQENKKWLRREGVKIFVRRGGPHQKEALQSIKQFLIKEDLYGLVSDQYLSLSEIVKKALKHYA